MSDQRDKAFVRESIDQELSFLEGNTFLAQRVLSQADETTEIVVKKKVSVTAIVLALLLMLMLGAAAAGSLGIFGRLTHLKEKMGILEENSSEVNASITVLGDTFTISQAYYAGNALFLSYSQTYAANHPNGKWMEPWKHQDDDQYLVIDGEPYHPTPVLPGNSVLQPGESCKIVELNQSIRIDWPNNEEDFLVGYAGNNLSSKKRWDEYIGCSAYELPDDAPDELTIDVSIQKWTYGIWRDEAGVYWQTDSSLKNLDSMTFTIKRNNSAKDEYGYIGPATCHWLNGETGSVDVNIRMVRCPELDLCYVRTNIYPPDTWLSWGEHLREPSDRILQYTISSEEGTYESIYKVIGVWNREKLYQISTFFRMDGTEDHDEYQLTPVWDEEVFGPPECVYDSITLTRK